MSRYAIVSVYDKSGLAPFVKGLTDAGIKILSTGGTAKFLVGQGFEVISISDYTGHPEILEGRVKSLHPKIHGGILARLDLPEDLAELKRAGIDPIEFVVVNLYPFTAQVEKAIAEGKGKNDSLVEFIDIGGPTMIRAAAKNCRYVAPICDPADYPGILAELKNGGKISLSTRQRLAAKVFTTMAAYDGAIARYFALEEKLFDEEGRAVELAPVEALTLEKKLSLRYGENPHQSAALYRPVQVGVDAVQREELWEQVQGKEISYNNLLDMHAAIDLFLEFYPSLGNDHLAIIIKHSNPCGVALRNNPNDAFSAARECDPISAFGGIIAISGRLDKTLAESILEGFVEVVLAGAADEEALAAFKKKKNVRLILCDFPKMFQARARGTIQIRSFGGDFLVQGHDNQLADLTKSEVVSGEEEFSRYKKDLEFAWKICKHVKSNTIVIAKNGQAIGVGAGQMSRVDAAKIAIERARLHGHEPTGSVAASDAFLPFPDTLEVLNDSGVVALVQPGGSVKDEDVIASAKQRKMLMVLTGERHFRH